jgi:hypothetical protein
MITTNPESDTSARKESVNIVLLTTRMPLTVKGLYVIKFHPKVKTPVVISLEARRTLTRVLVTEVDGKNMDSVEIRQDIQAHHRPAAPNILSPTVCRYIS